jgi:DNA repair protein RadA/Sms
MAKSTASYACASCGATSIKWTGRCTKCGEFGTVAEVERATASTGLRSSLQGTSPRNTARPVAEITTGQPIPRTCTGIDEFDRVLGGGLVPGQVLLLSGEPGAGKSTLLLMVADAIAERTGRRALYISGEESVDQIAVRAQRIGAHSSHLLIADETDLTSAW